MRHFKTHGSKAGNFRQKFMKIDDQILLDLVHLDFSFVAVKPSPFMFYVSSIRNARLRPNESLPNAVIYRDCYLNEQRGNRALRELMDGLIDDVLARHFPA